MLHTHTRPHTFCTASKSVNRTRAMSLRGVDSDASCNAQIRSNLAKIVPLWDDCISQFCNLSQSEQNCHAEQSQRPAFATAWFIAQIVHHKQTNGQKDAEGWNPRALKVPRRFCWHACSGSNCNGLLSFSLRGGILALESCVFFTCFKGTWNRLSCQTWAQHGPT